MMDEPYHSIVSPGTWRDNSSLSPPLGLCPLLAVATFITNGFAAWLTLFILSGCVFLVRACLRSEIEVAVIILITASIVSAFKLISNAYFQALDTGLNPLAAGTD